MKTSKHCLYCHPVHSHHRCLYNSYSHRGMGLIEVIIASFFLTVSILVTLAMQATIKKSNYAAIAHYQALALSQDIISRIAANNRQVTSNYIGQNYGTSSIEQPNKMCNSHMQTCRIDEMVTFDLYQWQQQLRGENIIHNQKFIALLTEVKASINYHDTSLTVKMSWRGKTPSFDQNNNQENEMKSYIHLINRKVFLSPLLP